ncbi:hypothetical protein HAX54_032402 [Datura stramonium]|uniref:Uncharacterized protein n=1 Tax=Datura stramonium TaxID=4076 RepID=A0ABS8SCN5_DATST|nr:hypothetical protein [Datura stramonium]
MAVWRKRCIVVDAIFRCICEDECSVFTAWEKVCGSNLGEEEKSVQNGHIDDGDVRRLFAGVRCSVSQGVYPGDEKLKISMVGTILVQIYPMVVIGVYKVEKRSYG